MKLQNRCIACGEEIKLGHTQLMTKVDTLVLSWVPCGKCQEVVRMRGRAAAVATAADLQRKDEQREDHQDQGEQRPPAA